MTREPMDCSAVIDRLIEGERPSSNSQLAEHVGSCLTCFRTASDLKGLPQLRRQLLAANGLGSDPGADPGPGFWAAFPAQVSAAWETSRSAAVDAAAASAKGVSVGWRIRVARSWDATRAWLRLPVPAALGGALCAAAIIVVAIRPWGMAGAGKHDPAAMVAPRGEEIASGPGPVGGTDGLANGVAGYAPTAGSLMPGGAMDDSLKELDGDGLWAVHADLERTLNDDVRSRAPAEADEPTLSNPSAVSDDLEELDDAGLALLAQNLKKGT